VGVGVGAGLGMGSGSTVSFLHAFKSNIEPINPMQISENIFLIRYNAF
jgi:hypothetical protein